MNTFDNALDHIDTLTAMDGEDYTCLIPEPELGEAEIEVATEKALLWNGHWLPYSQLRVDMDGSLWIANWLHAKLV